MGCALSRKGRWSIICKWDWDTDKATFSKLSANPALPPGWPSTMSKLPTPVNAVLTSGVSMYHSTMYVLESKDIKPS